MAYIAKHYVSAGNGLTFVPGEIFEAAFDREQEKRLLMLGAIEITDSSPVYEELEEDESEAVSEEDFAPPVIDVMDGVAEAPKKRSRRK